MPDNERFDFVLFDMGFQRPCLYDRQTDMLCPLTSADAKRAIFSHPLGWVVSVLLDHHGTPDVESAVVGVS